MTKTSCDWTVERLPWWANETLEEGERERVAAHLDECAACREELAATRQAMALYAAHLPVEALLALAEGGAGAAGDAQLGGGVSRAAADAHLGHCAACREELALLHESRAAVVGEAGAAVGTVTAFGPRRPAAGSDSRRRFDLGRLALAASLLVAVVTTGGWLFSHQAADERIAALERRFAEATAAGEAVDAAADADASETAGDAPAEILSEAEAGAAADLAAAERRIAELEARNADLQARAEEAGPELRSGLTYTWNAVRVRGAERGPEQAAIAPAAGEDFVVLHFTLDRQGPLVFVVETMGGRRVAEVPVATSAGAGDAGPSVSLPLDGLPGGTLRLRLLAGDEEIARGTLQNPR